MPHLKTRPKINYKKNDNNDNNKKKLTDFNFSATDLSF